MQSDAALSLQLTESALGERRKERICQPQERTAWGECGCSRLAPSSVKSPMPGAKSRWQLASKEGHCNVPSAFHLLPGKVIRRPPMIRSADAGSVSGIPAGSFLLGGVPGTRCEA